MSAVARIRSKIARQRLAFEGEPKKPQKLTVIQQLLKADSVSQPSGTKRSHDGEKDSSHEAKLAKIRHPEK